MISAPAPPRQISQCLLYVAFDIHVGKTHTFVCIIHSVHIKQSLTERISNLRWDILGGFNPDCGVPFSRRQDSHLIKELVYPREEICSVFGLVCHIMENLHNDY